MIRVSSILAAIIETYEDTNELKSRIAPLQANEKPQKNEIKKKRIEKA